MARSSHHERPPQGPHLGGTARSPQDVRALHALGLRFAEVAITNRDRFLQQKDAYGALKDELGIYYVCHGPREGDPNDTRSLESLYLPKLFEVLTLMPHLDMDLLTIHLWLDPRFVTPRAIDYKIGFLDRLIREAQPTGVTICLENLSETADHLGPVFQALPQLNLTLDIGHAQLLAEENTSLGFVARHAERIRHVHVHDNHGGNSPEHDLHLPLGQGIIDFKGIFQRLLATGYDRGISLELRPWEIEKCIHYIKEFLLPP